MRVTCVALKVTKDAEEAARPAAAQASTQTEQTEPLKGRGEGLVRVEPGFLINGEATLPDSARWPVLPLWLLEGGSPQPEPTGQRTATATQQPSPTSPGSGRASPWPRPVSTAEQLSASAQGHRTEAKDGGRQSGSQWEHVTTHLTRMWTAQACHP